MHIKVTFSETSQKIPVKFSPTNQKIPVRFRDLQEITGEPPEVDLYEGSYEVTPKVDAQTIPTAQKFLTEDMRIKEIPYFVTSNNAGGDTVYIAKEVD
jgi:hypothetical protein